MTVEAGGEAVDDVGAQDAARNDRLSPEQRRLLLSHVEKQLINAGKVPELIERLTQAATTIITNKPLLISLDSFLNDELRLRRFNLGLSVEAEQIVTARTRVEAFHVMTKTLLRSLNGQTVTFNSDILTKAYAVELGLITMDGRFVNAAPAPQSPDLDDVVVDAEIIPSDGTSSTSPDAMSDELTALLSEGVFGNDTVLQSILNVTNRAQEATASQLQGMSVDQFDSGVLGSFEEKMALAELQGVLAKHGLTPINTVEGLIKLRSALVDAYRDNNLVPYEVRLRAVELQHSLAILEAKRDLVVQCERNRAEAAAILSSLEIVRANTDVHIAEQGEGLRADEAAVLGEEKKLQIEGRRRSVQIDEDLLDRGKQAEKLEKLFALGNRFKAIFSKNLFRPAFRLTFRVLIPLLLVANLVADGPGRETTPVLGTANRAWDGIYMPVRDGVIRTYHNVRDDIQHEEPAAPDVPE